MGAVHTRGLRLRRRRDGEHDPREHGDRYPDSVWRRLARGAGSRGEPRPGVRGLRWYRRPLRAGLVALLVGKPRQARPAAGRARWLHRLQRPVWGQVCQPGYQLIRPDDRSQRQHDPGRDGAHRLPRLRRDGGDGVALLGRADAGGRHPDHLRIHLGCTRWPWHRRQHPLRIRPRRGRLCAATARLRHGVPEVLRPARGRRDHEGQHALCLHR